MSAKDKPFHNPFEALRGLGTTGDTTALPAETPESQERRAPNPPATPATIPRAVVRLERAGRRGKEVTVVEHLALASGARDEWLKALKAALGCGGSVEDERLVLQGDQRARLPALLRERGVKKVTMG